MTRLTNAGPRIHISTQILKTGVAFLLVLMAATVMAQSPDGRKVALVIGNGNYTTSTVSRLTNPPNDAQDVAAELREIGFDVHTVIDGTREEMGLAVEEFGRDLQRSEVGLFYYAGHGVQVNGANYLIPVDADLPNAGLVKYRTVPSDEILAYMEAAGTKLNLFFLDACRDNPLPQVSRSLNRGLAAASRRPPETMIVYATAAGDTADDGRGRNSPFTEALLDHISTPGQDVYDLYRNVSADVQQKTAGRQRPEQYGNVTLRYTLVPDDGNSGLSQAESRPDGSSGSDIGAGSSGGDGAAGSADATGAGASGPRFASQPVEQPPVQGPTLRIAPGSLEVRVATNADIYVDGRYSISIEAGKTGTIEEVPGGEHTITARYPGGASEEESVTVRSGRTVTASFTYTPPTYGVVRVSTKTAGSLLVDGTELGRLGQDQVADIQGVETGLRRFEMEYDNGKSETVRTYVRENQTAEAEFENQFGTLIVTARTEGTVTVDGDRVGRAGPGDTLRVQDVLAGERRVEMDYDVTDESMTVEVAARGYGRATFQYRPDEPIRDEVLVESGTFRMGSTEGDSDETPVHTVEVDSFFMMKTEVTHEQYIQFLNDRRVSSDGSYRGRELVDMDSSNCAVDYRSGRFVFDSTSDVLSEDAPMIEVTWYGAIEYANWLSEQDELTPVYRLEQLVGATDGTSTVHLIGLELESKGEIESDDVTWNRDANGWRLPTEAEWEYAARGGPEARDTTYAGSDVADTVGWSSSNAGGRIHSVGEKRPNELGLYDMSGNVLEWCWDWYDPGYYDDSPRDNPTGPSSGEKRSIRAGWWNFSSVGTRVANRAKNTPDNSTYGIGFRLVRSTAWR